MSSLAIEALAFVVVLLVILVCVVVFYCEYEPGDYDYSDEEYPHGNRYFDKLGEEEK